MECCPSACKRSDVLQSVETVRPCGLAVESINSAPCVELLRYELTFGKVPLAMASFPALAFRLARASVPVLKTSLASALAAQPLLAGRLRGTCVALTNDGVPFAVAEAAQSSAPEGFEEAALMRFADFRAPRQVRRGLEPLMTVKLTCFRDGSAVLAMCRSHAVLDGTSSWSFLGRWAAVARGSVPEAAADADVRSLVPNDPNEIAQEVLGRPLASTWKAWLAERVMPSVGAVMDAFFLSGATFPNRRHLFFADEEIARIKAGATAAVGWVSTQEALAAYLLLTVGRVVLPEHSKGRAVLFLLLDARKALGLPESTRLGSGLAFICLQVQGLLQKTLPEVASALHEAAQREASPEALRRRWRLAAAAAEKDQLFDTFQEIRAETQKSDLTLELNNQSKRKLPDFGPQGSGGVVQAVATNAGPTLILPAKGGIEVFFNSSFLKGHTAKALAALRSEIPTGSLPARAGEFKHLLGSSNAADLGKVILKE